MSIDHPHVLDELAVVRLGLLFAAIACLPACGPHGGPPAGLAEFEAWTAAAEVAYRERSREAAPSDATLGLVHCNGEIGDGLDLEPACSSVRTVTVGSHRFVFKADWSVSDPGRWHADADLPAAAVDCAHLTGAVEVSRNEAQGRSLVLCRTKARDQVLLLKDERGIKVAHFSAAFVERYPRYLARLVGS